MSVWVVKEWLRLTKYTDCCYSQDDADPNSVNCCTLPITKCDTCERLMCQYHGSTFSHALTCRTPAENHEMMVKCGLVEPVKSSDDGGCSTQ